MLRKQQIPNLLTFARVLAVPVALTLMVLPTPNQLMLLFGIFVAAAITDFFDGYFARKWNAVTPLGTMLDQISDKLLIALMLVYLLIVMGSELLLPVMLILLRELYISGLREFLALRNIPLPVSKIGKWKTATQMAAITLLLGKLALNPPHELNFPCSIMKDTTTGALSANCDDQPLLLRFADMMGMPLLYAAAALAVVSALTYTYAVRKHLR